MLACEYLWQHGKARDHQRVTAGYQTTFFSLLVWSPCPPPSLPASLPPLPLSQACLSVGLSSRPPAHSQLFASLSLSFKQLVVRRRAGKREIRNPPLCFFFTTLSAYLRCRSFLRCRNQKGSGTRIEFEKWLFINSEASLIDSSVMEIWGGAPDKFCLKKIKNCWGNGQHGWMSNWINGRTVERIDQCTAKGPDCACFNPDAQSHHRSPTPSPLSGSSLHPAHLLHLFFCTCVCVCASVCMH